MSYMTLCSLLLTVMAANLSCSNNKNLETRQFRDYSITAIFNQNDRIDGLATYLDSSGNLISLIEYSDGVKQGKAVNFYPGGPTKDSSRFAAGRPLGYWYHYDKSGALIYTDYSFYGLQVGPQTFYKNNNIEKFYFSDFNKVDLVLVTYDSLNFRPKLDLFKMNLTTTNRIVDNKKTVGLFAYLPELPLCNSQFSIGLTNAANEIKEIITLPNNQVFIDTILPLPDPKWTYYVSCKLLSVDSSINKIFIERIGE